MIETMRGIVPEQDILPILKKARSFLSRHAWGQGEYEGVRNGKLRYCAMGAVRKVINNSPSFWRLEEAVGKYLAENCTGGEAVINFNDEKGRTKKEILDMFSCAIEKIEANANEV